MSSTGIYFVVQQSLHKSEVIHLTIQLNKECIVQCEGKVIRADKQDQGYGIAVQFTKMMFG
ncbi:PilZ domain-containing protein [uncultured Nitrosomonas sp.]|uniref:PilZ domain-containing protein n=1 Tax=uncultured Nitrosomonas sp. TaxID=156424 RepID=UPI0034577DA5